MPPEQLCQSSRQQTTVTQETIHAAFPLTLALAPLPDKVEFNKHIRPIFSDTCFHCHGPDLNKAKAKLQLHSFAKATAPLDSDPKLRAIVPGKPDESEAVY